MKHLLEYQSYSDENIMDLLGDLEGVGQSTVARASVWIQYTVRRSSDSYYTVRRPSDSYAIGKMLTTDPFYVTGNEGMDSDLALKTIAEGKFVEDPPGANSFNRVQFLSKVRIQEMAKGCLEGRDEDGVSMSTLEYFGSELASESIKVYNARHGERTYLRVDFAIFIAPPGDYGHKNNGYSTLFDPLNSVVYRVK